MRGAALFANSQSLLLSDLRWHAAALCEGGFSSPPCHAVSSAKADLNSVGVLIGTIGVLIRGLKN